MPDTVVNFKKLHTPPQNAFRHQIRASRTRVTEKIEKKIAPKVIIALAELIAPRTPPTYRNSGRVGYQIE